MKLEGEEYCNTELLSSSQLPSCCSPACVEYNRKMSSNEIVKNEGGLNAISWMSEESGTFKCKRS